MRVYREENWRWSRFRCSSDVIEALSAKVHAMLDAGMARTGSNKRSTVRGADL